MIKLAMDESGKIHTVIRGKEWKNNIHRVLFITIMCQFWDTEDHQLRSRYWYWMSKLDRLPVNKASLDSGRKVVKASGALMLNIR